MKYEAATIFVSVLSLAQAVPVPEARNKFVPTYRLRGREVPQEHSHNTFLDGVRVNLALSNTAKLGDPVFGLLGNAAIIAGNALGTTTNPDCLHQAIADQAFTNAKAAQNVSGMVDALSYQALERNTAGVGVVSVSCNETAVNPEIAAVQQHQDPASSGAAATNKAIVLALAAQISAVGGDPQDALKTGTFAPGTIGDTTGAGNTCDTADDSPGCIFSQNLLVDDATAAEITAAVGSGTASSASSAASNGTAASTSGDSSAASAGTGSVDSSSTSSASAASATPSAAAAAADGTNVQTFTGSLGGTAPAVTQGSGTRPFTVNGDTFVGEGAALQRSCSIQNNACSNAANSGTLSGGQAQCQTQETACNAAAAAKKMKRAALDFGSCTNPSITFGPGNDGRTEDSFVPANPTDFNHGSALAIGVLAQFICGQLSSSCKAGADAIAACTSGQTAAASATGQAAATAFNSALGL